MDVLERIKLCRSVSEATKLGEHEERRIRGGLQEGSGLINLIEDRAPRAVRGKVVGVGFGIGSGYGTTTKIGSTSSLWLPRCPLRWSRSH